MHETAAAKGLEVMACVACLPVQLEKANMTPGLRAVGDKTFSLDELEVRYE